MEMKNLETMVMRILALCKANHETLKELQSTIEDMQASVQDTYHVMRSSMGSGFHEEDDFRDF